MIALSVLIYHTLIPSSVVGSQDSECDGDLVCGRNNCAHGPRPSLAEGADKRLDCCTYEWLRDHEWLLDGM